MSLGGFRQFVHGRKRAKLEWGARYFPFRMMTSRQVEHRAHAASHSLVSLDRASIRTKYRWMGCPWLALADGPFGKGLSAKVNWQHPLLARSVKAFVHEQGNLASHADRVERLLRKESNDLTWKLDDHGGFLPKGLAMPEEIPISPRRSRSVRASDRGVNHKLSAVIRAGVRAFIEDAIAGLRGTLAPELDRLRYLGPLRSFPPRHLAYDQPHDSNWVAGGGHAYDILRLNELVRFDVNRWLGAPDKLSTPYEIAVERLRTRRDISDLLGDLTERATQIAARLPKNAKHFRGQLLSRNVKY